MNDISLPTMTQEERQMLLDVEHRKPERAPHGAWWLPLWIVFLLCAAGLLALSHKPKAAAAPVPVTHTIAINPDATRCDMHYALTKSGWTPISSDAEKERVSKDKRKHLLPMPTLTCIDESSCDGKPPGCALKTFTAVQWWYETARLPARRVSVE